jgi:organic hydroperoxide reductase OsmC/OhrA
MTDSHQYVARVIWRGNSGAGTANYRSYRRNYDIVVEGKAPIEGSADPRFRGDAALPNPEDLLVSALSACHMLTYLALCADAGIVVESYEDRATALMRFTEDGGGFFVEADLYPRVQVADRSTVQKATKLHAKAHELCFIAQSVKFPVRNDPTVTASA